MSEARSMLTGRIVDTYTNILTVKLFARARDEDAYVREAIDQHTAVSSQSLRLNTLFALTLAAAERAADHRHRRLRHRALATRPCQRRHGRDGAADDDADRQRMSGWVAWQVTDIFENIGVVQEGMMTIARPLTLARQPDARTSWSRAARSASTMSASATAAKAG